MTYLGPGVDLTHLAGGQAAVPAQGGGERQQEQGEQEADIRKLNCPHVGVLFIWIGP